MNVEQLRERVAQLETFGPLKELCEACGWQGGTVHQVREKIQELMTTARAFEGYIQDTNWIQDDFNNGKLPATALGESRAKVMTDEILRLRQENEAALKLVARVARLNAKAGEIGAGMLASLVEEAQRIQLKD
jgi:hypothetical protein